MAETKYLDQTGLQHVLEGINTKFTKVGHKHTKADITDFAHTHDDRYYTETEIDTKVSAINTAISGKAASSHTHDDRYYTESEINTKLAGKSDTTHSHTSHLTTEIAASTNLNTLTTPGWYKCSASADAATCTNCPTKVAFAMEVLSNAGTTQIVYEYSNDGAHKIYTRNLYNGAWGAWKRIYTEANKPTPAEIGAAASIHTHTKKQITDFEHTHDDLYYTKAEMNSSLSSKMGANGGGDIWGLTAPNGTEDIYVKAPLRGILPYSDKSSNTSNKTYYLGTPAWPWSATYSDRFYGKLDWSYITDKPATYTPSAHTHNYAGSTTVGGSANSAVKLDTATAGSATQPVYFADGKPVATTYTLGKSVPADAKFTDTNTHYASKNVVGSSTATSNTTAALTNGNVYLNSVENGAVTSAHKISGSGATTVTTDTSGNIIVSSTNTTYSSLKNPYALTVSLNGTSQGAYDGSAAKSINVTASSVGAYTKAEVDSAVAKKANSSHTHAAADITSVNASAITGVIASANLPSYVDDVLEYSAKANFPATGEAGKIYVDTSTNITYRWGGSAYVEISPSLALGETSSTAYRGDRGAAAYTHATSDTGKALSSGLYKITTSARGHVTAGTAVTKADITGLGIPAQDTVYTHPTSSGNKHIPSGGSAGQFLKWSADGTAVWAADNNTWNALKGATATAAGSSGYVAAPDKGQQGYFLRGDATWAALTKSTVGLGNVDNTADANKSVKYATSAGSATNATYVKDSLSGGNLTITYAKDGQSSTSWLASWHGTELGCISPSNVTVGRADSATKATKDSAGQQINTTYIKGLSVSGRTITITKGNNTTTTITTQDTTYAAMTNDEIDAAFTEVFGS